MTKRKRNLKANGTEKVKRKKKKRKLVNKPKVDKKVAVSDDVQLDPKRVMSKAVIMSKKVNRMAPISNKYSKYTKINFVCYKEDDKSTLNINHYIYNETKNGDLNGLNTTITFVKILVAHLLTDIGNFIIFYTIYKNKVTSIKFLSFPEKIDLNIYKFHIFAFLENCCKNNKYRSNLFSNAVSNGYYLDIEKDKYIIKKSEVKMLYF